MANTAFKTPIHPRKQVKGLTKMRSADHRKASCTEELQEREDGPHSYDHKY